VVFTLSQHSRDHILISNIVSYLKCGNIEKPKGRSEVRFVVYKLNDILAKIIPLFKNYPLQGIKKADFLDFDKATLLLKYKHHLNLDGFKKVCLLKAGMNKGRINL
jgi:hypothetical protein